MIVSHKVSQLPSRVRLAGRPALLQDEMASSLRGARLTFDLRRVSDFRGFDTDFLQNRRSAGEAAAECFDKTIVALSALRTCCRARLLRECRRRRQPKSNEQGYGLERDAIIALEPLEHPHDAIQPLGDRSLPSIGIVRGKE